MRLWLRYLELAVCHMLGGFCKLYECIVYGEIIVARCFLSVTRVVERGRVKCGQYWPEDEDGIEQHGSFAVINSGIEVEEHYSITSLLLQNLEVRSP